MRGPARHQGSDAILACPWINIGNQRATGQLSRLQVMYGGMQRARATVGITVFRLLHGENAERHNCVIAVSNINQR